jgi:hypothetical protein
MSVSTVSSPSSEQPPDVVPQVSFRDYLLDNKLTL